VQRIFSATETLNGRAPTSPATPIAAAEGRLRSVVSEVKPRLSQVPLRVRETADATSRGVVPPVLQPRRCLQAVHVRLLTSFRRPAGL